jgi:hypothetical protein
MTMYEPGMEGPTVHCPRKDCSDLVPNNPVAAELHAAYHTQTDRALAGGHALFNADDPTFEEKQ